MSGPKLTGRWCYYVPEQDPTVHGGYVPSLVEEDLPGHWPMVGSQRFRGDARGKAPWVWGQILAEAREVCNKVNADRGISEREAFRIVLSSMKAGGWPRRS